MLFKYQNIVKIPCSTYTLFFQFFSPSPSTAMVPLELVLLQIPMNKLYKMKLNFKFSGSIKNLFISAEFHLV